MRNKAHKYQIIVNDVPGKNLHEYRYAYRSVNDIKISIGKQAVSVDFEMKTLKSHDEIMDPEYVLSRDIFRKIHQLHAVRYGEGLGTKSITVVIDDDSRTFGDGDPEFPFLYSMIENVDLGINDSWHKMDNAIICTNKSDKDKDLRFTCMFAYFVSKSKQFEVDKFTYLWTAINAYYNYLEECYINDVKENVQETI